MARNCHRVHWSVHLRTPHRQERSIQIKMNWRSLPVRPGATRKGRFSFASYQKRRCRHFPAERDKRLKSAVFRLIRRGRPLSRRRRQMPFSKAIRSKFLHHAAPPLLPTPVKFPPMSQHRMRHSSSSRTAYFSSSLSCPRICL